MEIVSRSYFIQCRRQWQIKSQYGLWVCLQIGTKHSMVWDLAQNGQTLNSVVRQPSLHLVYLYLVLVVLSRLVLGTMSSQEGPSRTPGRPQPPAPDRLRTTVVSPMGFWIQLGGGHFLAAACVRVYRARVQLPQIPQLPVGPADK